MPFLIICMSHLAYPTYIYRTKWVQLSNCLAFFSTGLKAFLHQLSVSSAHHRLSFTTHPVVIVPNFSLLMCNRNLCLKSLVLGPPSSNQINWFTIFLLHLDSFQFPCLYVSAYCILEAKCFLISDVTAFYVIL